MRRRTALAIMPGMVNGQQDNSPDLVDIQEAAKVLDVSVEALRKRITRGKVEAEKRDGHWLIRLADSVQTGPDQDQTLGRPSLDNAVDGAELALAAMESRIASLEAQLIAKDEQQITAASVAANQIGELHRLLAQTALNAAPVRSWWKFW